MNNEITYKEFTISTGEVLHRITYANDEMAFVDNRKNTVSSVCDNSTAIRWWQYDVTKNELVVLYKNNPTYYHYAGVPYSTLFAMLSADSLGAFVAKEIKPNFTLSATY